MSSQQKILQHLIRWRSDPVAFIREVIGARPTPQQLIIINSLLKNRFIAVRSGNKVGKTAVASWMVIWFLCCFKEARVPCTSPSESQLLRGIWQEVGKWYRRLPDFFKDRFEFGARALSNKQYGTSWQAYVKTATKENPEVLSGAHSNNIFLILDEASGIDREIIDNALPLLGSPNAYCLMIGNPLRTSGFFFDVFHGRPSIFRDLLQMNSEESPMMQDFILEAWKQSYGANSSYYKIHVLGEFPDSDEDQLIPLYSIDRAKKRTLSEDKYKDADIIWGIDVGLDHDASVIAKRQGCKLLELVRYKDVHDTIKLSSLISEEYRKEINKPKKILIDEIGIGRGTLDTLSGWGLPVQGVNVGTQAVEQGRFANLKAELWHICRDWFVLEEVDIPNDQDLIADLVSHRYQTNPSGKIKMESKDQVKRRIGRSPDSADALVLTFIKVINYEIIF